MKGSAGGIFLVRRTLAQIVIGRVLEECPVEVALEPKELFTLKGDQRGARLAALHGHLWVTQLGDSQDIVLRPGERVTITRRGMVVVQALGEARLRVTPFRPG
jgi:hypothetical protein